MARGSSGSRGSKVHEYDFHGLRALEAERRLKRLLDRHGREPGCTLHIIHGKGTGILAEVVRKVASAHPRVDHVQRQFVNDGVTRIEIAL